LVINLICKHIFYIHSVKTISTATIYKGPLYASLKNTFLAVKVKKAKGNNILEIYLSCMS